MVKFSKQFEGQLVPEWKEAFVDYWQLKKDLKIIQHLLTNNNNNNNNENDINNLRKQHHTFFSSLIKFFPLSQPHKQHEVIQVHKKLASSASRGDEYETELFEQFAESNAVKDFFTCLDQQLNKVNQFYKAKEKEFLERGECLKRQTEILVELKSALKEQREKDSSTTSDSREDASISSTIFCEDDSAKDGEEQEKVTDETTDDLVQIDMQMEFDDSLKEDELEKPMRMKREDSRSRSFSSQAFNCQGKNLKINIPLTTPTRTLSAVSFVIWGDLISQSTKKCSADGIRMNINKMKLNRAEKMIRGAFLELYKGLNYLKTYRNLNMLAFMKILKKLDKITGKQVHPIYLKVVESSYFNSSDKAINLADEVEELFIKHFTGEDRKKAMTYLRPHHRRESHSTTFFIGLFTGCLIALFAGYAMTAHITGMYRRSLRGDSLYMETIYPILSMFSLLFLHFFLYGCNIFAWKKTRINYAFIFELAPTKELRYRDVFLICTTSMTVIMGVMFVHLALLTKGYSYSQVQVIPGFLLLVFLILLMCPFDIAYHSSRHRFLRVIRNIILSPLYKVVMLDFFMADQLCSQVPMLRHLEFVTCYYITGSYKTQDYGHCMGTKNYRDLAYAVSFLPYYWRAMQCARRWFDEGETSHLINLGKYVSAMLAAGAKVAYEKDKNVGSLCLVVIISSAATIYQLYWDFVKDWGLLQMNCKNPWLRNDLMLRQKSIYYVSMVLNLILRLAWLQTVLHYNFENVDYRVTGLFLAALEVLRRGLWNFYRLENEHLNNAGKFRAVKIVPLPFHEVDEED